MNLYCFVITWSQCEKLASDYFKYIITDSRPVVSSQMLKIVFVLVFLLSPTHPRHRFELQVFSIVNLIYAN